MSERSTVVVNGEIDKACCRAYNMSTNRQIRGGPRKAHGRCFAGEFSVLSSTIIQLRYEMLNYDRRR